MQLNCKNSASQNFTVSKTDHDTYNLVSENSGLCVTIPNGSSGDYLSLAQFPCDESKNQEFAFEKVTDGLFSIRSVFNDLCLDILQGLQNDYAPAIQYQCKSPERQISSMNQLFSLVPVTD